MKNLLGTINDRLVLAEEGLTELANRSVIIVQSEEQKKRRMRKNEERQI